MAAARGQGWSCSHAECPGYGGFSESQRGLQHEITCFVVIPKQGDIYLGHLYKSYNPHNIYTQHVMLAFTTRFHGDGFSCCSYEMHIVATKPLQAFLDAC